MTQLSLLERAGAEQLPLALDPTASPSLDDVIVAPECAAGVRLVASWPAWPSHAVILSGPSGSGKTHLAEVWAGRSDAVRIRGTELAGLDPTPVAGRAVLIEHIDIALRTERPRAAQTGLFHLLNTARETRGHLLLTTRTPPGGWSLALPDLASRLSGATHIALGAPSEAQMVAVLHKLFADRQLAVAPPLVATIVSRLERSLRAARELVERVDRIALAEHRKIDRSIVAKALAGI